jgi:hypothetical protein
MWIAQIRLNQSGSFQIFQLYDHLFLETQYKHIYSYTYKHSSYEYTHTHPTPMSTFERLSRLDLEINKVDHQECLTIDRDVAYH